MAMTTSPGTVSRGFSRVVLTLDNVFIPTEKLTNTPSMQDGLDNYTELDLRNYGCELIQTAGVLLKLPQVAMATGQVLFQRYYYSRSFVRHNMEITAIAAVHLASKIEEAPRRIRDCLNVFHHMKQVKTGRTIGPMVLDQNYVNIKNEVIKAERRCLKELGFCVHVKHPHKIIVTILGQLEQKTNQRLAQFAWNYMNDSFRTDVFMRFSPAAIASACIFLAARQLQVPLPNNPPWYYVFDANDDQVQEISLALLRLYARPKVLWDKLENAVVDAKRRLRDNQVKERLAKDMASGVPSFEEGNSPSLQVSADVTHPANSTSAPIVIEAGGAQQNADAGNAANNSATATGPNAGQSDSKADANRKNDRREDADLKTQKKKHRDSRSRSRSPRRRSRKASSSKHRRRHRHRRHSSTSPGDGSSSRSSSRSNSSGSRSRSSSSSSASSHRRGANNNRDGKDRKRDAKPARYENGDDRSKKQDSKRGHHDRNYRSGGGRRSRSRSASTDDKHRRRGGEHRNDSRGRDRSSANKSSSAKDSKRSPPRARDSGGNHVSSRHNNGNDHHRNK